MASMKSANDMAQAWVQKTVRPNPQQEQKQTEMHNATKFGRAAGATSVANTGHDSTERITRWVELLGRCIGAQLSTLVAPVLEPDEVEIEPERSAVVLAEIHAQAAEARMLQCRDEATTVSAKARSWKIVVADAEPARSTATQYETVATSARLLRMVGETGSDAEGRRKSGVSMRP